MDIDKACLELINAVGGSGRPGCATAIPDDVIQKAVSQLASVTAERDALAAQLAALKKRVADAVKSHAVSPWGGLSKGYAVGSRTVDKPGRYALVRLEDGE